MKIEFKRGLEKNIPKFGNVGTLYFTEDTRRIFEGNGYAKPLSEYSNVIYKYENYADLIENAPKIEGKIYITKDMNLYFYNNGDFINLNNAGNIYPDNLYEKSWENQNSNNFIKLIDIKQIFTENQMMSISQAEFTIFNTHEKSNLDLYIMDKEIKILETQIEAKETQKYILGISPNIKVFVKGSFNSNLYINYHKNMTINS